MRSVIRNMAFCFCASIHLFVGSCCVAAEDVSLSKSYPKEDLRKILVPRDEWRPFPKAGEKDEWNAIRPGIRQTFIAAANEYLDKPIPDLPATLYLEYKRIGNRSNYQDVWYERRGMLHTLVLAECMEGGGHYLDALANVLWAICEESSWVWPAHVGAQKAGVDLPDTNEPVIDLFSAETTASLAWTVYLLKERLDTVSPLICRRVEREIDQRMLRPYLQRNDFGWMGFGKGGRPNNWNPWINSNVLAAGLLTEKDENRRLELVHKVLRSVDNFYVPYPADGSCDEGPGYWGHAGASLFDNLELLYSASNGRFDVYDRPKIRQIGRFTYRAHICGDYFVNVSDCDGRLGIYRDLVFRYGRRIDDPNMQALAAHGASEQELFEAGKATRSLGRLLYSLFNAEQLLSYKAASAPLARDVWLGDEDMQMMAARDRAGVCDGLYVACWGSHNAQSHNHNDVGNFIIFADGQPVIIDAGAPTYTRQTFSGNRYEIWAMQSAYHNLPTINGVMQQAGRQYAARDVNYESSEDYAQVKMDISPAYPEKAGVKSWIRTVRLDRGRQIRVTDSFDLNAASSDIVQTLLTPCEVMRGDSGSLMLRVEKQQEVLVVLFDGNKLTAQIEPIDVSDERLAKVWGPRLSRILLKANRPVKSDI